MILEKDGLSFDLLKALSFKSNLKINLKNNLHYFDYASLIADVENYIDILDQSNILSNIKIDYRIKSLHSVKYKYDRYYPNHQFRKVFNDILGFRALCDNYDEVLELSKYENIRIADMSKGKACDDGYRGVHAYFQVDNFYYPIEIQYNTYYDRQLNNWLHKYLYKKPFSSDSIGYKMRAYYENGKFRTENEFKEVLEYVLSSSEKI